MKHSKLLKYKIFWFLRIVEEKGDVTPSIYLITILFCKCFFLFSENKFQYARTSHSPNHATSIINHFYWKKKKNHPVKIHFWRRFSFRNDFFCFLFYIRGINRGLFHFKCCNPLICHRLCKAKLSTFFPMWIFLLSGEGKGEWDGREDRKEKKLTILSFW